MESHPASIHIKSNMRLDTQSIKREQVPQANLRDPQITPVPSEYKNRTIDVTRQQQDMRMVGISEFRTEEKRQIKKVQTQNT